MLELIKELSLLDGVSGDEGAVRERIIKEIDGKCEWSVDPLGNIIALKKGKRATDKKIQLSAHMDEVGFIITHIGEDGLLRFAPVGGIDVRVTLGKRLRIGRKRLCGVVGLKPIHLVSEEEFNTPPKMDELYIDIGKRRRGWWKSASAQRSRANSSSSARASSSARRWTTAPGAPCSSS